MSFLENVKNKTAGKAYNLVSQVKGGREKFTAAAHSVTSLFTGKNPRVYLKPGNVIQIISRSSERALQIVVSKTTNQLICDAIGGTGLNYTNAHWLVVRTKTNHYHFHNCYNYIAIKRGQIVIIPCTIDEKPPNESEFLIHDVLGSAQGIYIESVHMPGYFLCFNDDGDPCNETKIKIKDKSSQFETQIVEFGPGVLPENDTIATEETSSPPSYSAVANASNDSFG